MMSVSAAMGIAVSTPDEAGGRRADELRGALADLADGAVDDVGGRVRDVDALLLHGGEARLVGAVHADGDEADDDAEDGLDGLDEPHREDAAADAGLLVGPVGHDATPRAREEVHEREARAERASDGRGHAVVAREVRDELVVHAELDAEAEAVGDEHDERVGVREAEDGDVAGALGLLLGAHGLELLVRAVRQVAGGHDEAGREKVHDDRDDHGQAPGEADVRAGMARKISMMKGIVSRVMPPPRLPQPPAVALTVPTMDLAKNWEHHTWHVTKVASERPMMMRAMTNMGPFCAAEKRIMPGMPMRSRMAKVLRAPKTSHMGPARTRMTMVPVTAKAPASERVFLSRARPPSSTERL